MSGITDEDMIEGLEDLTEEDVNQILDIISKDGFHKRAEIVKVVCPACGEDFVGTKRHAGGFIAGHKTYHEFVNTQDLMVARMGGM